MADKFTYRNGQREMVKMEILAATVVERNDMIGYVGSSGLAQPAADETWDTNLATTQANFAAVFIGIADESSSSTQSTAINVDISAMSIYQYAVPSGTFELGDSLGPDKDTGNAILSQTLEGAVGTSSIARARRQEQAAVTFLHVSFASAYNLDGNNVNAVVG